MTKRFPKSLADDPTFDAFLQHALQSRSDHNVKLLTRAFHFAKRRIRIIFASRASRILYTRLRLGAF